jgi:hypothetical protein
MRVSEIALFDKQQEAASYLFDPNWQGEMVYGGGARGGKSILGCVWIIGSCFAYPGSAYLIGFEELKHLRRTTLPDVVKTIQLIVEQVAHKNWQKVFKLNRQDMIIEFINGSKIFLAELDDLPRDENFDRLGSYSLTGVWIDEAQKVSHKAKSTLSARLSLISGKNWKTKPKALYTCNPSKNWIYSDFYKPIIKDKLIVPNKLFIRSLYTDNPTIDHASYKAQVLASGDKVQIERLLHGNFDYDDNPNKLYEYDKILDLFTNTFVTGGRKYITCDIALQGSDRMVIMVWSGYRIVEIHAEEKSTGKGIEQKIKELAEKHLVPRSHICFDNDGVGGFLGSYLQGAKPFVNNSKALLEENYQNLKTQCYFKLAPLINQNKMFICETLYKEQIIQELDAITQKNSDKDGKLQIEGKEIIKEKIGRSPDFADSIMMRMLFDLLPAAPSVRQL